MVHLFHMGVQKDLHASLAALFFQQRYDVTRGSIAEHLAERFLVIWNLMLRNQGKKILRRVTGERGLAEMWIRGDEVLWTAMNVGKVAAAAAGDENLLPDSVCVVQHGHPLAVLSGFDGAQQACSTGTENEDIKNVGHFGGAEAENFSIMPCRACSRAVGLGILNL